MKKAFTLIELLVVVLIIGILSAIALPQYQKAVMKSRFAEAMTNLRAIAQADAVCKLEKGRACFIGELPIEIGTVVSTDNANNSDAADTAHFRYFASGSPDGYPSALYSKEDVCLCWRDGNIVVGQDPSMDCAGPDPTMDYAKLLNLAEDNGCICC